LRRLATWTLNSTLSNAGLQPRIRRAIDLQYPAKRNAYEWVAGSTPADVVWVVIIILEIVASLTFLRIYPHLHQALVVCAAVVGLTFAGGLLSLFGLCETSVEAGGLYWRKRSWLGMIVGEPAAERRIPLHEIAGYRRDKAPWSREQLTILLGAGSCVRIPKRTAAADPQNRYDVFLAGFRLLARSDPGHIVEESGNVWRTPLRRAWVGGIVAACVPVGVLAYQASAGRRDLIIVVVAAALIGARGIRFLVERDETTGR
jgi:hypothetical protein